MSGETGEVVSGWTTDTLHDHLQTQIASTRDISDERYQALHRAEESRRIDLIKLLDERFESQQHAVEAALAAADKAVLARQDNADREFHEHLEQVRHENALALTNADKAVKSAFEASDRAISKSEVATEKRFESVNEFRAQLQDQAHRFMPRTESESKYLILESRYQELREHLAITDQQVVAKVPIDSNDRARFEALARIDAAISSSASVLEAKLEVMGTRLGELQDRMNRNEGKGQGYSSLYGWMIAALGLVITVVVAANAIFGK